MTVNYSNENSFNVYIDYLALKKHFSTLSYDYHKYNGKVKSSFDTFQTRKDVFYFYKLSKNKNYHQILLANMIYDTNLWIGDIVDNDSIFLDWKRRNNALTYTFTEDLKKFKEVFKENFVIPRNEFPYLMKLFISKSISPETFTIVSNMTNVLDVWENNIIEKHISKKKILLAKKYYNFLEFDKEKFSNILRKTIIEV